MSNLQSPEEMAEAFVVAGPTRPGEDWCIHLTAPGVPPVLVGSHGNPSVVGEEAKRVRQFVVAVIRAAREGTTRDHPAPP